MARKIRKFLYVSAPRVRRQLNELNSSLRGAIAREDYVSAHNITEKIKKIQKPYERRR